MEICFVDSEKEILEDWEKADTKDLLESLERLCELEAKYSYILSKDIFELAMNTKELIQGILKRRDEDECIYS